MGRDFSLEGRVHTGKGLGLSLGFPTANVVSFDYVVPGQGVYAAYVLVKRKVYLGVVNIGSQPTVSKSKKKTIEVHLVNFNQNIINKTIKFIFLKRLRKEKKFPSLQVLKTAIRKDIDFATAKYSASIPKHTQLVVA